MAKYSFEARGPGGKDLKGEIEAASEQEARVKLRAQRLIPLRIVQKVAKPAAPMGSGRGIPAKELQIFTRQLSTLLGSGIPILQAIEALSTGSRNTILKSTLKQVNTAISSGRRLADALADHPRIFDRLYVNMIRAGEESGSIDVILARLAEYIEKSVKIRGKVKGAMVYPIIILAVAGLVVAGLLIFVIPKFESLFNQSGSELPALTKIVVFMSKTFIQYWYLIFGGIILAIFGLVQAYKTPKGKVVFDQAIMRVPLFGDLVQKAGIARATRTMSTLLASGVSIIEAIDIAGKVSGNYVLEMVWIRAKESITEGRSLILPLQKEKFMPPMVIQMIGVGEQTGSLDAMLGKIADFYEDEVDVAVSALTSIIEPLLMVFLGVIIAFIVVAMYLPIFNLANAVAK